MALMVKATAKDKFYGPLKRVARDYLPLLLARMKVLEKKSHKAIEYLEADADEDHDILWGLNSTELLEGVVEAQADLHKSVLEASTCQALVGAFIELLQEDYVKIRDTNCFYLGPDGDYVSLYEGQDTND
tara:strand:+ start:116 stop:505 length:390 start_codon:yes stop_codon:yes gene_type:complete